MWKQTNKISRYITGTSSLVIHQTDHPLNNSWKVQLLYNFFLLFKSWIMLFYRGGEEKKEEEKLEGGGKYSLKFYPLIN